MTNEEYIKMQEMWLKATGVKEDSWVKVTREAENHESGWGSQWVTVMTDLVGKTCRVIGMHSSYGLHLETVEDGKRYGFPFFVLEPAEAPKPEKYRFQPFEQVLVRDEDDEAWRISLFERHARDSFCFACIHGFFWKQCIPYAGHEHLLDTTDEPEDWAKYYDKE